MALSKTPTQEHIYVSLLSSLKSMEVDWDKFARRTGIKAKGNAQRKLKQFLEKDGLALKDSKIVPLGGDDDEEDDDENVAADAKKTKTEAKVTKAKGKTTKGKRKAESVDGEKDSEPTKVTKKAKQQATLEESEEDD